MGPDLLTQIKEPGLIQVLFHLIHILVKPLDIVQCVRLRTVDAVEGSRAGIPVFGVQLNREAGQGAFSFLGFEQFPDLGRGNFKCDSTAGGVAFDGVEESSGEVPHTFPQAPGATATAVSFVSSKDSGTHKFLLSTITLAHRHPPFLPFLEGLDDKFVVMVSNPSFDVFVMGAVPAFMLGFSTFERNDAQVVFVATRTPDGDFLPASTCRIDVIRQCFDDFKLTKAVSNINHSTPHFPVGSGTKRVGYFTEQPWSA